MATPKFENYRGKRRWTVVHPKHGKVTVAAPDEATAIVAAAKAWDCTWTALGFYAYCNVYPI